MKRRIRDMFGWKKKGNKISSGYEGDNLSIEKSSMPTQTFSLDPEEVYSESNIETEGVAYLVESFQEVNKIRPLLRKLAEYVSEIWAKYNDKAHGVILQAIDRLRETLPTTHHEEEMAAADGLRSMVQWALAKKARRLVEVQKLITQAREDLRSLAIGVFGSPERVILLMDPRTEMFVSAAIMSVAVGLEFFVNFGVIQWATDDRTSSAFSLIAGLVASVAAHLAADARRQAFAYADAMTENKRWSEAVHGIDPVTKKRIGKPFPLSAGLSFQSKLSHSLWIGLCAGILLIRGAIVAKRGNWGDLAGSFGFVALVGAYYLFKVTRKGAHARIDEYVKKGDEIKEYEKELKTLSDPMAEDVYTKGIVSAFSEYKKAVGARRPAEAIARAKAELIRLRDRAGSARGFFLGVLQRLAKLLSESIERVHGELADADPSEEEIEGMLVSPNPLAHENPAIAEVLAEAERPAIEASASAININVLVGEIWPRVLEEQRRVVAEEEQHLAIRAADTPRRHIPEFRPGKRSE